MALLELIAKRPPAQLRLNARAAEISDLTGQLSNLRGEVKRCALAAELRRLKDVIVAMVSVASISRDLGGRSGFTTECNDRARRTDG
jgi:hypothetical protein